MLADDKGRLVRRGLGTILNKSTTTTGPPRIYAIKGSTAHFWPKADKAYTGTFYYYFLDAALGAATVPVFPDDWILTNYVWLKCREWLRMEQAGTAMAFADARIADLQKSGIGPEAEEDQLGIDPNYASNPPDDSNSWMGSPNAT